MVLETRQQSMAWMEHGFQISLKNLAHLMEDKMLPGALGRTPHSEIRGRKKKKRRPRGDEMSEVL